MLNTRHSKPYAQDLTQGVQERSAEGCGNGPGGVQEWSGKGPGRVREGSKNSSKTRRGPGGVREAGFSRHSVSLGHHLGAQKRPKTDPKTMPENVISWIPFLIDFLAPKASIFRAPEHQI